MDFAFIDYTFMQITQKIVGQPYINGIVHMRLSAYKKCVTEKEETRQDGSWHAKLRQN